MANILEINRPANKITLGTNDTTINVASHTASKLLSLDASKNLSSDSSLLTPIFAGLDISREVDGDLQGEIDNTSTGTSAFATWSIESDDGRLFLSAFGSNYNTLPFYTKKGVVYGANDGDGIVIGTPNATGVISFLVGGHASTDEIVKIDINGLYVKEVTKLGDGGTTNYTEIKIDGEINLHGTARVINALWVDAGGIKAPGSKPATEGKQGVLETPTWIFADQALEANQESISWNMRVPNRMDRSVAPTISIGWSADGVSPGVCEWQLEYLWTALGEDTGAAAQETLSATGTAAATADGIVMTTFTGIDAPSETDVCIHCRLTRLSADGSNDTIADTVELHGVCFGWTSNKLGQAT